MSRLSDEGGNILQSGLYFPTNNYTSCLYVMLCLLLIAKVELIAVSGGLVVGFS